jgi:outer membrane protein assembly factor BamD
MNRKSSIILVSALALILVSCSSYQKLLKSSDNELKYTKALEYYEQGKYVRAQQLFDIMLPFFKGTEKAEKISFYNAYCYYKQGDYILGSYYFRMFANNFSASQFAEEAAYMSAYCSYLDSPRYSLDQTNTYEAISSLQLFITQFPKSERITECNKLIDELRAKLEEKAINIAMLYSKMNDYKASIVSLNNVLKDFPDTKSKEKVLFFLLQSKYQYAVNSVAEKRQQRLSEAMDTYDEFQAGFPKGEYSDKAATIKKSIEKEIKN